MADDSMCCAETRCGQAVSPAGNCPTQNHEVKLSVAKGQTSGTCQIVKTSVFRRTAASEPVTTLTSCGIAQPAERSNVSRQSLDERCLERFRSGHSSDGIPQRNTIPVSDRRVGALSQKAHKTILDQRHADAEQFSSS